MSITLETLDVRHAPEPPCWEDLRLASGQPATWRYGLLKVHAWMRRSPTLLTVLRDGSTPVGAVCASLERPLLRRGSFAPPAGLPRGGILEVRLPGTALRPWFFLPGLDVSQQRELLRHYVRGIRAELGWAWHCLRWRALSPEDRPLVPASVCLTQAESPGTRLAISWRDLDGWYGSLRKDRRGTLRRHARNLEKDTSVRLGPAADLVTAAEATALWAENLAKYNSWPIPQVPYAQPYADALINCPEVLAVTYRDRDSGLLALSLILDHDEWPVFFMWGAIPRERGGCAEIYFDNYVRMVEWAISSGKAGMFWGRQATEVKRDLGAELVPLCTVTTP